MGYGGYFWEKLGGGMKDLGQSLLQYYFQQQERENALINQKEMARYQSDLISQRNAEEEQRKRDAFSVPANEFINNFNAKIPLVMPPGVGTLPPQMLSMKRDLTDPVMARSLAEMTAVNQSGADNIREIYYPNVKESVEKYPFHVAPGSMVQDPTGRWVQVGTPPSVQNAENKPLPEDEERIRIEKDITYKTDQAYKIGENLTKADNAAIAAGLWDEDKNDWKLSYKNIRQTYLKRLSAVNKEIEKLNNNPKIKGTFKANQSGEFEDMTDEQLDEMIKQLEEANK